MGGIERGRRWKNFKQRLGLNAIIGCCGGASWSTLSASNITITEEADVHYEQDMTARVGHIPAGYRTQVTAVSGMNLSMALAAERNLQRDWEGRPVGPTEGPVKTLKSLIEETDGIDWRSRKVKVKEGSDDAVCCVCMERNKGAAFIPCGHTFCRVCSREVWVNRGCCPICNRSILEILDIF